MMSGIFKRHKSFALPVSALLLACLLLAACGGQQPEASSSAPVVSSSAPAVSSQPAPLLPDRDIDFASLTERNEDVVAWVEVPGSVIDYPVVYSEDNVYYLNHDLDGEYYVGGSIFADMANAETLTDPVVAIYGHFMPDDTLFTQLHRYEDRAYFDANPVVKLYTPKHQFNYRVVAALTVDDRYIFYNMDTGNYIDYRDPDDVQYFLDWINNTHDLAANVDMEDCTVEDKYLVLSTCTQLADSNDRYILVAMLDSVI